MIRIKAVDAQNILEVCRLTAGRGENDREEDDYILEL